jgi:hypothetical protein
MAFILNATIRIAMSYSLAEAAAAVGLNKTSILRAIKSGKISGTKDPHGQWFVEPAELHRVYPPIERSTASSNAITAAHAATPRYASADAAGDVELRVRVAAAEGELAALKEMLVEMRKYRDDALAQRDDALAQREDMRKQRDDIRAERDQLLALPAPSGQGVVPPEAAARSAMTSKQRMLKFWFGREYRRRAG